MDGSGKLTLRNRCHLRPILFTRPIVPVINTSNEVPKDIPPFVRSPEKKFGDVTRQPTQVVLTETEIQAAKSSQPISRTQDVARPQQSTASATAEDVTLRRSQRPRQKPLQYRDEES